MATAMPGMPLLAISPLASASTWAMAASMRPAGTSTPENSLGTVAAVASQAEADGDALCAIGEPAPSEVVSAQIRNRKHRAILISNNPWLSPGEATGQATKSALAGGYRASLHE